MRQFLRKAREPVGGNKDELIVRLRRVRRDLNKKRYPKWSEKSVSELKYV